MLLLISRRCCQCWTDLLEQIVHCNNSMDSEKVSEIREKKIQ